MVKIDDGRLDWCFELVQISRNLIQIFFQVPGHKIDHFEHNFILLIIRDLSKRWIQASNVVFEAHLEGNLAVVI